MFIRGDESPQMCLLYISFEVKSWSFDVKQGRTQAQKHLISPKKLQPQTHLVQGNSTSSPGVDIALRIFT